MKTKTPLLVDFIKDKFPQKNYLSNDWRNYNIEYIIAHILIKSGITKIEFGEQGLYDRVAFSSLTVNNFIPVAFEKRELPLFWGLLRLFKIPYGGGAGNDINKPYAQACLGYQKIENRYLMHPTPINGLYMFTYSKSDITGEEVAKNIFCYFHHLLQKTS